MKSSILKDLFPPLYLEHEKLQEKAKNNIEFKDDASNNNKYIYLHNMIAL